MRQLPPMKIFSLLLLVVMLTAVLDGAFRSARAAQVSPAAATLQVLEDGGNPPHGCPCPPTNHNDCDDCDDCADCICNCFLTSQLFSLSYKPFLQDLHSHTPFSFLPEVYLSRFIPPQNQA